MVCSVAVILCGGNIDTTVLGRSLERGLAADGRLVKFCVNLADKAGSLGALTQLLEQLNVRWVTPLPPAAMRSSMI